MIDTPVGNSDRCVAGFPQDQLRRSVLWSRSLAFLPVKVFKFLSLILVLQGVPQYRVKSLGMGFSYFAPKEKVRGSPGRLVRSWLVQLGRQRDCASAFSSRDWRFIAQQVRHCPSRGARSASRALPARCCRWCAEKYSLFRNHLNKVHSVIGLGLRASSSEGVNHNAR